MTTIFVNGRFYTQQVTGVQRFAREITSRLAKIRKVVVLVPDRQVLHDVPDHVDIRATGRLSGHLWEQVALPAALRDLGTPLLLGLTNTGPLSYRNQIATHHDVTYVRHPQTYSWRFRTAYRLMTSHLLSRVRRLITVSEFSKREIISVYGIDPTRIDVVHNAVSPDFVALATPQVDANRRDFLAVGSLLPHKNLALVQQAFEQFRNATGSSSQLRVVGSVPQQLAGKGQHGLHGVQLLGRVTDEQLAKLYASSRALVFASTYEGFGIPALEAQALGLPVISSDAAALVEILGDSAVQFDSHSAAHLAAAFERVDSDALLRSRLVERGRDNVARFSWDSSAEQVDRTIATSLAEK